MQRGMGLPVLSDPSDGDLRAVVQRVLDDHWVPEGYAAPNTGVYPWQWLWDSCFHVLVWRALGDRDRAQRELAEMFRPQGPSGFVPHVNYVRSLGFHEDLWGRRDGSAITQPPMYGHAVAELVRAGKVGADVSADDAKALARICALNALAAVHALVGLDSVTRVVKVVGFVASAQGFGGQPGVVNGASDLFGEIFGDAGAHARSAVGVAELPLDAPVEVEVIVEIG